jgi:hypothetical protein
MPMLFDVLCHLHLLEKLVIFHHHLGDELVELLMNKLTSADEDLDCHNENQQASDCVSGLKELYLSHCSIGCKGALKIAAALVGDSTSCGDFNRLKHLQVLSLGSNRIKKEGASSLARVFAECPSLHRMVLHGNEGLSTSDADELVQYALDPDGWQQSINTQGMKAHATPMATIIPLIIFYVQSRWQRDRVLVRPYELARQKLLEEIHKKESTFVDDRLEEMPEILSWMGRVGMCSKPPSNCQSQLIGSTPLLARYHSFGCKDNCQGCRNVHLNDLYLLMKRMPHLAQLLTDV